jgi:hypothetical protein
VRLWQAGGKQRYRWNGEQWLTGIYLERLHTWIFIGWQSTLEEVS